MVRAAAKVLVVFAAIGAAAAQQPPLSSGSVGSTDTLERVQPRAVLLPPLAAKDVRRVIDNVDASLDRIARLASLGEVSKHAVSPGVYAAYALTRPPRPPPFGAEFKVTAG